MPHLSEQASGQASLSTAEGVKQKLTVTVFIFYSKGIFTIRLGDSKTATM